MTLHLMISHRNDVCNCPTAQNSVSEHHEPDQIRDSETGKGSSVYRKPETIAHDVTLVAGNRAARNPDTFATRLPRLDPLRWRASPVENEMTPKFKKEYIEYGVNIVPSMYRSIEGVSILIYL